MAKERAVLTFLSLFTFVHLASASFYEVLDQQQKTVVCYAHNASKDPEAFFNQLALGLPQLLDSLVASKGRFILTIPDAYDGYSPIANNAAHIEGARVALAWASSYCRFDQLDVEILRVQSGQDEHVEQAVADLVGSQPSRVFTGSPEDQFENRMHLLDVAKHRRGITYTMQPIDMKVFMNAQAPMILSHNFLDYSRKRAVVTGGAGFLGSFIVQDLLKKGYQVIVLDNFFCCNEDNLKAYSDHPNLVIHRFDVTKPFDIDGPVDIVVHLASIPSPAEYYRYPKETLKSGLFATYNTLKLAAKKKARFIFSSTSEVYGDPEISPQHELYAGKVNPYGKRSQYDESKRGSETLIRLFYDSFDLDVRIARIFNSYGPRMRLKDGRVITNFLGAIMHNKPLTIYGDGTQTRSFAYVSDTADSLVKLITTDKDLGSSLQDRIFNVGSQHEFSINELAQKVDRLSQEVFGRPATIVKIENPDKTDPKLRRPNVDKLETVFGKRSCIKLEQGLRKTLNHFMDKEAK